MKQAMRGKVTPVAYQNVDIGKGPGNVVYKVGPKAGLQQCGAGGVGGADGAAAAYKAPNHLEADSAAAWNIIALSMYIRSQSPDSNGCVLAPLASTHLNSTSLRASEGEKLSTSNLYSGTTFGTRLDQSNFVSKEKNDEGGLLERISSGSKGSGSGSWCCDSGDAEKSCLSHSWGERGASLRLPYASRWGTSDRPSQQQQGRAGLELSSSSSIGECEDSSCSSAACSHEESFGGEMEVESVPRGGPLNHMSALESSLPIKRGLSKFWSGKAKSFTSLTAVSSIEDLAKAEDPYARRRRITSTFGERHKSFPPLSRSSTSGISKRTTSTSGSRSGLAMAFAMGSTLEEVPKVSPPSGAPLARHSNRSMSLTDLYGRRSYQFSPPGAV